MLNLAGGGPIGSVKYHIPTEVRDVLRGKKTKVDAFSLWHAITPDCLSMLKASEAQAGG